MFTVPDTAKRMEKKNWIYVIGHQGMKKVGKGVTLSEDEAKKLYALLNKVVNG